MPHPKKQQAATDNDSLVTTTGSESSRALQTFKNLIWRINPVLIVVSLVAFYLRCDKLDCPREVVFDELHYIKFITLYAKRIFFFDTQPPLGKQLLTLASYAANFKGDLNYNKIGDAYKPEVPIKLLRSIPCLLGTLISPLSYLIAKQLNFHEISASLVALLVLLENALHTQSRFLLLEPFVVFLSLLSVYCYLKFARSSSISWLTLSAIFSSLAFCTKYSGFYTYLLIVCLTTATWWSKIEGSCVTRLVRRSCMYFSCLAVLPVLIYLAVFYVHLSWLTKAGPHDSIMTSAFQASLENGLATVTKGQPLKIVHGSQITLRHTHGRSCWLHSHEHVYPIKYADGRGSSHQQQVTCYSFKDTNNWWIVKRPHLDELVVNEPHHDVIRDGDMVQLVHGLTARLLNSHDVASAMSLYSQEVSCYIDYNISMPAMDVWRVHLMNPADTSSEWHTITSRLQLVHLNSSSVLRYSGKHLPEWGFHQHEVVADREKNHQDSIWNVEEHRYTKSEDQKKNLESQLGADTSGGSATVDPSYSLSFFEKFLEIHYKLFNYQQDIIPGHIYACESPLDWVLMNRGIAYWVSSSTDDNAQIFLIGNVTLNRAGVISILALSAIVVFYCLRRQRHIYQDLEEERWLTLKWQFNVLIPAYLAHLAPYFLYETPLFLQYYLNALVFKILAVGALVDHLLPVTKERSYLATSLLLMLCYKTHNELRPLTYGSSLTRSELEALRWKDTWQLLSVTG